RPERHHRLARRTARQRAGELGDEDGDVVGERKALARPPPHALERRVLRGTPGDEPGARDFTRSRTLAGRIGSGEPLLQRGRVVGQCSMPSGFLQRKPYIAAALGKLRRGGQQCSKPAVITNGAWQWRRKCWRRYGQVRAGLRSASTRCPTSRRTPR